MPTQQRANQDGDGQHRLTDMVVEEVSFVDRGANKKRFLVVKRDGGEMAAKDELVPDGRGGMRRVSKSNKDGEGDEEGAGKKKPFGGNKAPPFKPKPKPDDEEEEAGKANGEGDEEEEEEEEEEADKGKTEKGVARKNMLGAITQAIELLMECAEALKDGDDGEGEGEYAPPAEVTANAKKALDLLAKMLGSDAEKGSAVETGKAGRRMSKERLDRFTKALADLQSILKEVMASPELKDDAEKRGAALLKAFARVSKGQPADGAYTGQLLDALTELTEHVRELEAKNAKLEKRITLLRKGEGVSNALEVETRGEGAGGGNVEWPMDLNDPIDRAHTAKETSFYEEE